MGVKNLNIETLPSEMQMVFTTEAHDQVALEHDRLQEMPEE